jgi:hypothetical protein
MSDDADELALTDVQGEVAHDFGEGL